MKKTIREYLPEIFDPQQGGYWHKLSTKDRAWLSQFLNEYYQQNKFKNTDEDIHNTTELRRKCYRANNERNRDMYFKYMRYLGANSVVDILPQTDGTLEFECTDMARDLDESRGGCED